MANIFIITIFIYCMLEMLSCHKHQKYGIYGRFTKLSYLDNKLLTRWLLWTKPTGWTIECAANCQVDATCVSFQVNLAGGQCRGYAVNFNRNSFHENGSGYKMYESKKGEGFIGSSCRVTTDCSLTDSVCINKECMCDPGLAFSPKQRACVANCTRYGSEFSAYRGYYILRNNMARYYGVTAKQCRDKCTATTAFICRSADRLWDGLCDLTSHTLKTVAPTDRVYKEELIYNITHYSRDCAMP